MTGQGSVPGEDVWGPPLRPGAICLEPRHLSEAAATMVPGEDPAQGWIRYHRALALLGLRCWLKERDAALVIGPEIEPEAPDRLLAIQGFATQLLCTSPLASHVNVPLAAWSELARAPQLVLLAQVDEENGIVTFPGVLDASTASKEMQKCSMRDGANVQLPTELFKGGLERLLRWTTLLEPEAIPRARLSRSNNSTSERTITLRELQRWVNEIVNSQALISIPVAGARGQDAFAMQLITPKVTSLSEGIGTAKAICATPSIWAAAALAEIIIEREGRAIWHKLATSTQPIEGPIQWPIEPLMPHQSVMLRLRPFAAPGGTYANVRLTAPGESSLRDGQEIIARGLRDQDSLAWDSGIPLSGDKSLVSAEVSARHLISLLSQIGTEN